MKLTRPSSRENLEKALMGGAVILSAYIMKIGIDAVYEKVIGRLREIRKKRMSPGAERCFGQPPQAHSLVQRKLPYAQKLAGE